MQHTSVTPDEQMNSLIYETFFCVNIYGSYKLLKAVRVFLAHLVYTHSHITMFADCHQSSMAILVTMLGVQMDWIMPLHR